MNLGCLKILPFINHHYKNIQCLLVAQNIHEAKIENYHNNKKVIITKRGKAVSANPNMCRDEQYCLNCTLCDRKACVISPMEQSKIERAFISYLYSKMENMYLAKNSSSNYQK